MPRRPPLRRGLEHDFNKKEYLMWITCSILNTLVYDLKILY